MAQRSTVPAARSSIWDGLPTQLSGELERVLDNRLGGSSLRSMSAALKIWVTVCTLYSFDPIINTDSPLRGGQAAAFVLYMVADTSLVWASIENYVWAWREWMVLQKQADPVMGIMSWDRFMDAVKVLTIVPGEPRLALPVADLEKILLAVDLDDFLQVQFGFFLLVLFFTFSRSECPCPKTLDGFDPETHWQGSDFKLYMSHGRMVLGVRFKKIKQDRRMERPSARPLPDEPNASGDWVEIGDVPDSPFSIVLWARRLFAFRVDRSPHLPFFRHQDRVNPFTYTAALSFLRRMQGKAGVSKEPGLHGIRVEGNNLSKEGNGEELTQFHGGWLSTSGRRRYDRFNPIDVLSIPARMLGRPPPTDGTTEVRDVLRIEHTTREGAPEGGRAQRVQLPDGPQRVQVPDGLLGAVLTGRSQPGSSATPVSGTDLDSDQRSAGVLLPPGYTTVERTASNPRPDRSSRMWKEYFSPEGLRFQSRAAAWRHHLRPSSEPGPSNSHHSTPPSGGHHSRGSPAASQESLPPTDSGAFETLREVYRARPASPLLPSGSATPSLAQRSRRTFVPASDVAAQLEQIVRAGGKGSRMAHELR